MNNIFIKGNTICPNLSRKIILNNGTLVIVKRSDVVYGAYMAIPFRDNKNRYCGDNTSTYCSLVDLDNGQLAFEERCSRNTTVRRVLSHVFRLGCKMPYDPDSRHNDYKIRDCDVEVYTNGTYKIGIELRG